MRHRRVPLLAGLTLFGLFGLATASQTQNKEV